MSSSERHAGSSMIARTPNQVPLAPYRINSAEGEEVPSKLLSLVGEAKRILVVGRVSDELVRSFERQQCEVVIAAGMTDAKTSDEATIHERFLTLPHGGENDSYDVVIFLNTFEQTQYPIELLQAARRHVRGTGCVIARVANVAHGSVRLALMAGRFPFGEDDDSPVRFFTYESLVGLFDKAGFALGAVEREEEEFAEPSDLPADMAADLYESVVSAPDSMTAHFLIAALPMPSPRFGWLLSRMRVLTEKVDASRKEAAEAREDLDAVKAHVRLLIDQQTSSVRREKELQAKVLAAHERMMSLDAEYRSATEHLAELQNREQWWQEKEQSWASPAHMTAVEEGLRTLLTACSADLAHARHLTHLADVRAVELEARLLRIRKSLPGRLILGTRSAARWLIPGMPYRAMRRLVRGR